MTKYVHLFRPIEVKNLMFRNRIISAPMGIIPSHTHISSVNYGGISIYDKSLGGAAVINISSHGSQGKDKYRAHGGDPFEKYQRDVTREQLCVAKQGGALCSFELGLTGFDDDGVLYGPSDIPFNGKLTVEMPEEIMLKFAKRYAMKVKQIKDFGFDMVLIHFGHDSLAAQFLSPAFNKRKDSYGGSIENRMKFPMMVLDAVRDAVGNDFVIEMRVSAIQYIENSYGFEDILAFIKAVEEKIDIVNVSCGMDVYHEGNVHAMTTIFEPHLKNAAFAEKIKKECNVLVDLVGAVMTAEEAEEVIAAGKADFIMSGRQLVADPYWPKKALENRAEDIVPCLRCLDCYHIATDHYQTICSVNPRFRRENRVPIHLEKAEQSKHVVVIGGGPAGLKTALVACERGHKITLIEKSNTLGGQLTCADHGGKYKIDLKRYKEYLITQVRKSEIKVIINTEATPDYIRNLSPDAIIIAVGASPMIPKIKGADKNQVIQAVDAYKNLNQIGSKVAVIGGGAIGCELGLELAEGGKHVSIIEITDTLSAQGNMLYRIGLRQHMEQCKNLNCYTQTKCTEITDNGVSVQKSDGTVEQIEADTIILATGMKSNREQAHSFYNIVPDTYMVGDCVKVAKVLEATNDAYFIAANL